MGKKNTLWQRGDKGVSRHLEQLDALCQVSQILSSGAGRRDALCHVLNLLDKKLGLHRGTITLLAPDGKELRVEAVHDLSERKSRGITYRVGEGVTGKVTQTGKAAVVARVSREPLFLNRFERWNVTKQELSFVCVPIGIGEEVIGTISVDRPFDENATLDEEVRILGIVASMIASDLRARREAMTERRKLEDENLRLRLELGEKFRPEAIIGKSNAMRDVCRRIQQVAQSDAIVLIRGESGTGRELVARAIHHASSKRKGPFVGFRCVEPSADLLERELLGYDKGAFAGASQSRTGRLEEANEGTLFLHEIANLPPTAQTRLVRVLQDGQFERVGGSVTTRTNARIIAATRKDLEKAVDEGCFRRDLYCQINGATIVLPPLRERKGDILLLADHFVEQCSKKRGKDVRRISAPAIDMMVAYHWPGNVRELENCIERAVSLSTDGVVHAHHLPPTLQTSDSSESAGEGSFKDRVHLFERDLLVDALKRCNGNLAATARDLKVTARIVRHRVKELGIDCKRYSTKRG